MTDVFLLIAHKLLHQMIIAAGLLTLLTCLTYTQHTWYMCIRICICKQVREYVHVHIITDLKKIIVYTTNPMHKKGELSIEGRHTSPQALTYLVGFPVTYTKGCGKVRMKYMVN